VTYQTSTKELRTHTSGEDFPTEYLSIQDGAETKHLNLSFKVLSVLNISEL